MSSKAGRTTAGRGHWVLTVVDALGDGLEDLEVDEGGGAVVAVVLVLGVADDAVRALVRGERERRGARDARHDLLRVEGEDGGVDADLVRVQDRRVRERLQDRRRELRRVRERVLVRAVCRDGGGGERGMGRDGGQRGQLRVFSRPPFPVSFPPVHPSDQHA